MASPIIGAKKTAELKRASVLQRPLTKNSAGVFHVNDVVPDDGRKKFPYLKGMSTAVAGPSEARLAGSGGIYYRPAHGDKMITVAVGETQYTVGQMAKDGTDVFSWLNDGDLLIAPPGNIYFMQGGEIMGLLEDYFPNTSGLSLRKGMVAAATEAGDVAFDDYELEDDAYLFNITVGAEDMDVGECWTAEIVAPGDDGEVVAAIAETVYMKSFPENVRLQKPVFLTKGQSIRITYTSLSAQAIWADLDLVR